MKKLILVIALLLLILPISDARMVKMGDNITIMCNSRVSLSYAGIVTDINNNLICINSSSALSEGRILWKEPTDICIGIGTILAIQWPKEIMYL